MFKQLMSAMRGGSKSKRRRRDVRNRPRLERLEKRELMAGNVTANVTGGDLVIHGDNADNSVAISRVNDTTYDVRGERAGGADTRINGVAKGRVRLTGVTDDVIVVLNGGDDEVSIQGSNASYPLRVPDSIYVFGQAGNDHIFMKYVQAGGDIRVDSGSGRDSLIAVTVTTGNHMVVSDGTSPYYSGDTNFVNIYGGSRIGNHLWVSLNRGDDTMKSSDTTARHITVWGYDGDDTVRFNNVQTTFSAYVYPEGGGDTTSVELSTFGQHLVINENYGNHSGRDHNRIEVTKTSIGSWLYIPADQGGESVYISNTDADVLYADLGRGHDWLDVKGATARSYSYFSGGDGRDKLNRDRYSWGLNYYGFEW